MRATDFTLPHSGTSTRTELKTCKAISKERGHECCESYSHGRRQLPIRHEEEGRELDCARQARRLWPPCWLHVPAAAAAAHVCTACQGLRNFHHNSHRSAGHVLQADVEAAGLHHVSVARVIAGARNSGQGSLIRVEACTTQGRAGWTVGNVGRRACTAGHGWPRQGSCPSCTATSATGTAGQQNG